MLHSTRFQYLFQATNITVGFIQTKKMIILRVIQSSHAQWTILVCARQMTNRISDNEIRHVKNETRSCSLLCIHARERCRLAVQLYSDMRISIFVTLAE